MSPCFLIPVYNHHKVLGQILSALEPFGLPCILVDDGSDDECRDEIVRLAGQYDWVESFRLQENGGKGKAVVTGFELAEKKGFTHALQLDADGQHNLEDVPLFLSESAAYPDAMILGQARYDNSVPASRLYGRYITHFWVWVETWNLAIRDSMCGFRVYPLATSAVVGRHPSLGMRMDFDIEIVVRLSWMGVPVKMIPTLVRYPQDGVSHFDVLHDNVRISRTHASLFFGMLWRIPLLLAGKLGWRRNRSWRSGAGS